MINKNNTIICVKIVGAGPRACPVHAIQSSDGSGVNPAVECSMTQIVGNEYFRSVDSLIEV